MSDSGNGSDPWVKVEFSPDPGYVLLFGGYHAVEELGHPFLLTIDLSSDQVQDAKALIGSSVTIVAVTILHL